MSKLECFIEFNNGTDCCEKCKAITITLENNADAAQGSKKGIYHISSIVNGKPSWTSTSNAIWYTQGHWLLGPLEFIGQFLGSIYSSFGSQCPYDLPSEMWFYWNGYGWLSAEADEINVDCSEGNYFQ